ncbi:hypothetical protein C8Q76DRAFT_66383 [Earliella scabrosa]|nr:hypothetical protein C8Q76DRAFT_66383 [Earliella scabrosa]
MDHSRLPIDVCEDIIDACYEPPTAGLPESYSHWCATALVCSDWSPRSRFNLLYEVILYDEYQVDLLLRTLEDRPSYADLITRFAVSTLYTGDCVPFSRVPLLVRLKNCTVLDLWDIDWRLYPRRYIEASFLPWSRSGIVMLYIETTTISDAMVLRAIVRSIWSLHRLETLYIYHGRWDLDGEISRLPGPPNWATGALNLKMGRCEKLRLLSLNGISSNIFCASNHFPD